jgi:DNA polymerase
MVMIDMPSASGAAFDAETDTLFNNMLKAMALGREAIYLAPLSPTRPPGARLDAASERALAGIARHHIGLVKPKALLLFGDSCARALLGGPVMATRGRWHEVVTSTGSVRATATIRPENMLNRPAFKKTAWEDLQMVMEELKG